MARTSNKESKIVKSIPNTETGSGVVCYTKIDCKGDKYIITNNPIKGKFTLWKCIDGGYERIVVSDSPVDFDDEIPYEMEY